MDTRLGTSNVRLDVLGGIEDRTDSGRPLNLSLLCTVLCQYLWHRMIEDGGLTQSKAASPRCSLCIYIYIYICLRLT